MENNSTFKSIESKEIRTRFAPSPTGYFHIGNARTALFNFLFARKNKGKVVLRIEDTDKERSKPEYEKNLIEILKWLGIGWDEGPDIGGEFGPYRQSERTTIYRSYLEKLLEQNKAYHCFCSKQDLEAQRQYLMSISKPPVYSGKCANLSQETIKKYLAEKRPSIIRFRTPIQKIVFEDIVKGRIEIDTSIIGDFPIAKDLDSPLYNFACVIDDAEAKISHVVRGDDHLPNTPKQILIYNALGLAIPKFAHLPMVLAPDRSKLSKRKHHKVAIEDFRKEGYSPEALINLLAFLGWNPGTDKEFYSLSGLIKDFSLKRVKKGGAIFNINKLDYLNGHYIRLKPIKELTKQCIPYLEKSNLINELDKKEERVGGQDRKFLVLKTLKTINLQDLENIISLYHKRLKKLSEIPDLVDFFFKKDIKYTQELLRWKDQSNQEIINALDKLIEILSNQEKDHWTKKGLQDLLVVEANNFKPGDRGCLLWPLRSALTGKKASASPFDVSEIIGKEGSLKRLQQAKEFLVNPH